MVFTEEQLQMSINPFTILDEAVYLTEQETTILPQMVPIVENNRLQSYIIDFNGIRQLSESTGLDYIDSIVLVSEQEGIDPSEVCIAIDEADIIESPELANLGPIVVRPLSELDDEFQFCLEAVNAFMDTEDEAFLDLLSEADVETSKPPKNFHKFKGRIVEKIKKPEYLYRRDMDNLIKIWKKHRDINDQIPYDDPVSDEKFHLTNAAGYRLHRYLEKKHNRLGDNYGLGALKPGAEDAEYQYHYNAYRAERRKRRAREEAEAKESSTSSGGNTLPTPKTTSGSSSTPKTTSSGGNTAPNPNNSSMSFGKKAAIGAGIAAAVGGGILAYKHYRDKPKSVIAKRIAALRSIYQKFLHNAQSNPEKADIFKRMAAKILGVIDKLLSFLQRKADGK